MSQMQSLMSMLHTSCNSEHPHDADDGGVDGQRRLLNLLQSDAHDGQ